MSKQPASHGPNGRTRRPRALARVLFAALVAVPARRALVLSELHANIQDLFNENGVQIMTPNYEADPAQPKVVASADWFRSPTPRADAGLEGGTAGGSAAP